LPARAASALELGVAIMLVVLGGQSLLRARREGRGGWAAPHSHGGSPHEHAGAADHVHVGPWALARRPLFVGLVHGLAGSGALAALALASMPSLGAGLGYVVVFGLGSIGGMALVTGAAGLSLSRIARGGRARAVVLGIAGIVSIGTGIAWGAPVALALAGGA
jgi:high-affinity nickel-transport protein